MNEIIKINKLTYRYEERFIFDKLSLEVNDQEWLTISGPNACGKTTLMKLISGILKTDSEIYINNISIRNTKEIRPIMGIMFDNLDDNFVCETIKDEISFALKNLNYKREYINNRITELSMLLNIKEILDKSYKELSALEKVKASLAVAISHNPRILLIDGTISFLEDKEKSMVLNILKSLKEQGLTIINFTQDLNESYYSDRLIIISNGNIVLEGTPIKVMEYDKILNKIGIKIPFEIELSVKLKLYGLIDDLYPNNETIVSSLWE